MFNRLNFLGALLVIGTILSGCALKIISFTPRSVIIQNQNSMNAAESQAMAQIECQKYGRHAIHRPDNIRDGNVTSECVE